MPSANPAGRSRKHHGPEPTACLSSSPFSSCSPPLPRAPSSLLSLSLWTSYRVWQLPPPSHHVSRYTTRHNHSHEGTRYRWTDVSVRPPRSGNTAAHCSYSLATWLKSRLSLPSRDPEPGVSTQLGLGWAPFNMGNLQQWLTFNLGSFNMDNLLSGTIPPSEQPPVDNPPQHHTQPSAHQPHHHHFHNSRHPPSAQNLVPIFINETTHASMIPAMGGGVCEREDYKYSQPEEPTTKKTHPSHPSIHPKKKG